jgi:hypothetical protein
MSSATPINTGPIFRTENSLVLWAKESAFGQRATPNKRFGLHEVVTAPDPTLDWYPFYGVASPRSRLTILRGRWDLRGSVPDIKIRDTDALAEILAQAIGRVSGSQVIEGLSATDERISSMTMQVAMRDTDGHYSLIREYYGGKINRMTLSAVEGEELRLNLDEIIFKDMGHNLPGVAKFDGAVTLGADPGPTAGGRFVFAGATISFFGVEVARIRRFALSLDNMLEPKYYLTKPHGDPDHLTQVCSDIVEGKRAYSLEVELDVADKNTDLELFKFLLNQGATGEDAPTIGGVVNANFAVTPGEGSGSLIIEASLGGNAVQPGSVVTQGKISIPAPPAGLFPSAWTLNVDRVRITTP